MRRTSPGTSATSTPGSTIRRSSPTSPRRSRTRPRSASATTARSRRSTPPRSPRRSPSASGSSRRSTGRSRTPTSSSRRTWPTRRGARSSPALGEKAAALDTQLLFFGLEWAAVEDDAAEALLADPALDHWRHHLHVAAEVTARTSSPSRRSGSSPRSRSSGSSAWSRLYEELLGALRVDSRRRGGAARAGDGDALRRRTATRAGRPPRRSRSARPGPAHAHVRLQHRSCSTSRSTTGCAATRRWISSRNLANETTDEAVEALIHATTSRYDVPQRYYRLKARLLGPRPARALRPLRAGLGRARPCAVGRGTRRRRRRVLRLLRGDRRDHRRLLRRQLDRRAGATGQADGAFCATTVPGVHPYVLMNYTGERRCDPDARARARSRAARRARTAARALQLLDAADHCRDRLGLRRGPDVRAAARPRTTRAGGSTSSPAGSRTRSRRRSARSR